MMKIISHIILILSLVVSLQSCLVKNDMAYPRDLAEIAAFEVAGQASVHIDNSARTISIELTEAADIENLEVTRIDLSEYAVTEGISVGDVVDLSSPLTMHVKLGESQNYEWTISASQTIGRYVTCQGQIGQAEIDEEKRIVHLYVADTQDIRQIVITSMKLEAEGSVIKGYVNSLNEEELIPIDGFPITMDCLFWNYITVECKGKEYKWDLFVNLVEVTTTMTAANAWARHIEVKAMVADASAESYFQYKLESSDTWTDFTDVELSGTDISATIPGLQPQTAYQVRVVCGEEISAEMDCTTESEESIHNLSFDSWYQDGRAWMPNLDESYQVWDSANPGSATFGFVPTTPTDDVAVAGDGKKAVRMETLYALVKLAAGNIYTGKFGDTVGTKGAFLDWGVPFTGRPTALRGYYKYSPKTIDHAQAPYNEMSGQTDVCQIQILLTDWDTPFTVNTTTDTFVDFDNDNHIIAFGKLESNEAVSSWREFQIDLDYRDRTRTPKYIVITACSSKYGDYFTGGVGSTLYVDEFELVYE